MHGNQTLNPMSYQSRVLVWGIVVSGTMVDIGQNMVMWYCTEKNMALCRVFPPSFQKCFALHNLASIMLKIAPLTI